MKKEIKKIVKQLEASGWRVRLNNHYVCQAPTGKVVTISHSPSCRNAIRKIESDIRRALDKK
jgi:predicted RNA binding protein YcfA (HicA-like mRNA interferase family)